jgi:hypothetical protein
MRSLIPPQYRRRIEPTGKNDEIHRIFRIPDSAIAVAYLCNGYVDAFPPRPTLESVGWAQRLPSRQPLRFDDRDGLSSETDMLSHLVDDPTIWRDIFASQTTLNPVLVK